MTLDVDKLVTDAFNVDNVGKRNHIKYHIGNTRYRIASSSDIYWYHCRRVDMSKIVDIVKSSRLNKFFKEANMDLKVGFLHRSDQTESIDTIADMSTSGLSTASEKPTIANLTLECTFLDSAHQSAAIDTFADDS